MKVAFFFFLIYFSNCVVSSLWGGVTIRVYFSSCKFANTKTVIFLPSLNSLDCLQFISRKCIDFPSSPVRLVKGCCLYSAPGTEAESPVHAGGSAAFCQLYSTLPPVPRPTVGFLRSFSSHLNHITLVRELVSQAAILCSRSEVFLQAPLVCLFICGAHSLVRLVSPCLQQFTVLLGTW